MSRVLFPTVALTLLLSANATCFGEYELAFSTFFGGSDWEHARDVYVDEQGNVYIVGGTQSSDFPTTEGAFQREHDQSGDQIGSGGYCDAFVCKFSPEGKLIWSTLLGGPNYDRAYAVEVDAQGDVFVSGRAGPGFPVTEGAFQTEFRGLDAGIYGMQNGFIAKLKSDGSGIEWASYVGINVLCRDLSIDQEGNVYLPMDYRGKGPLPPDSWFQNAFQKRPAGGTEIGALKVHHDGGSVEWATWLGGAANEVANSGIRIDSDNNVFLNFTTNSTDVPTTQGAHDRTHNGGNDAFIAKLSPDGSQLLYGTYFGGTGDEEGNSTHNLAVDLSGNAYLATSTSSQDLPTTEGAIQRAFSGGDRDIVLAKFSPMGKLTGCTYLGGSNSDGADGVYADAEGNVFLAGSTDSTDFPVTRNAIQSQSAAPRDAIAVVLAADFSSLNFSTYLGGDSYDDGRSAYLDENGNLYITGSTNGPGWPLKNAWQLEFAGGGGGKELCYEGGCFAGDVILMKIRQARE